MRTVVGAALALLLLALAGCNARSPEPVTPALWEVTGPSGEQGWLLGTIHALPKPVDWRSAKVDAALKGADRLVLEINNADDPAAIAEVFTRLAQTPGQPPLDERVSAEVRKPLARLMARSGLNERQFDNVETWAVAITLSQAASKEMDSRHGIDREIMRAAAGKPVTELEGSENQLRIFDNLPEEEQRDLLAGVVQEASNNGSQDRLAKAWSSGDMAAIEAETHTGILADPELRAALLVERNAAWADKLDGILKGGTRPLVAVGAAHMAGPEGLPALLSSQGYVVRRIQ